MMGQMGHGLRNVTRCQFCNKRSGISARMRGISLWIRREENRQFQRGNTGPVWDQCIGPMKRQPQWRSKALRGPGSTLTRGPRLFRPQGLKLEAKSAESMGWGLWGGPAIRPERCKLPLWGPQPPRVLMFFVFSDDISCH